MQVHELKGKNVILYPQNRIAKILVELKHFLPFKISYVFNSENNYDYNFIERIFKEADYFLIVEESPVTLLMRTGLDEEINYRKLIQYADQNNVNIISLTFEEEFFQNFDKKISIKKIETLSQNCCWEKLKKNPSVVIASVHEETNLLSYALYLEKLLKDNNKSCYRLIIKSYGNLFQTNIPDRQYDNQNNLLIMEGFSGNPVIFNDILFTQDDIKSFDCIQRISPDCAFLIAHASDTVEMISDTIELYKSFSVKVIGIVIINVTDPWQVVYIEEMLGVPVIVNDSKEADIQWLEALLNYFDEKEYVDSLKEWCGKYGLI